MCARLLLPLLCLFLAGCNRPKPDPDPPGYELVIPADVPERLALVDKDGTQHEGKGRELYAGGHRSGWRRCWDEHQQGRVDPRDKRVAESYIPQAYAIEVRGFVDGFKGCQRFLLQKR
jgi:hypothetical protein